MLNLVISLLWLLIAVVILIGVLWIIVWVLEQVGVIIPPMAVKIGMIVVGLLVLIWLLTIIAGGGHDLGFPSPRWR